MIEHPGLLRVAYTANILILLPVCIGVFAGRSRAVFEGRISESRPLSLLIGSYWSAILVLSVAGLWVPAQFTPILLLQVIYKAVWLATFAVPALVSGQSSAIPRGIALSFALIVIGYPLLLWAAA